MKISKLQITLQVFVTLAIVNCSPKELGREELEQYAVNPENGLVQTESVKGTEVSINYRPSQLLLAQELDELTDTSQINSLRRKYNTAHYLLLNISKGGQEALSQTPDFNNFSELLQTLSFRMGDKVTLATSDGDTLLLADYAFQRTYGMSSSNALLFAFMKKDKQYEWLEFTLQEFGLGSGTLRFRFDAKAIEKVPALQISSK